MYFEIRALLFIQFGEDISCVQYYVYNRIYWFFAAAEIVRNELDLRTLQVFLASTDTMEQDIRKTFQFTENIKFYPLNSDTRYAQQRKLLLGLRYDRNCITVASTQELLCVQT